MVPLYLELEYAKPLSEVWSYYYNGLRMRLIMTSSQLCQCFTLLRVFP